MVWHLSLQEMDSFNKSECAILPRQAMLPKDVPLILRLHQLSNYLRVPFVNIDSIII